MGGGRKVQEPLTNTGAAGLGEGRAGRGGKGSGRTRRDGHVRAAGFIVGEAASAAPAGTCRVRFLGQRPARPLRAAEGKLGRPRPLAAPPPEPPGSPTGAPRAAGRPHPPRGAEEKPGGCRLAPVAPLPPANP